LNLTKETSPQGSIKQTIMHEIRRLKSLPQGLEPLIDEIAAGMGRLYGDAVQQFYRHSVLTLWRPQWSLPEIWVYGAFSEAAVTGVLMAVYSEGRVQISLLHVLEAFCGQGMEAALLSACMKQSRKEGASSVRFDAAAFAPMDLNHAFLTQGFRGWERQLMHAPTRLIAQGAEEVAANFPDKNEEIAACLADAYRAAPDKDLHFEMNSALSATHYLQALRTGALGLFQNTFVQSVWREGDCAGAILGCAMPAGPGFVLYVGVRPQFQHQGIATGLLRRLARAFEEAGLQDMLLGVTTNTPPQPLYESLGFRTRRPTEAFLWTPSPSPLPR
jgi:ribosomal protein S18 acetylase RimI-like enzyme